MECMFDEHDESIMKQFVSSWNDRKVAVRGLKFEVNKEVISKATSLAM